MESQALRNELEGLRDIWEFKRDDWNETFLHGPMNYAKTPTLQFRVGNLDLPERRKRYTSSREEEDAQMCPCGEANKVKLTLWENVKCTRRSGMCWTRKSRK